MSWKTIIPLVMALAVGLVTVKYGRNLIAGRQTTAVADTSPKADVLVASGDFDVGHTLTAKDVKVVQAPPALVPTQAVKEMKRAEGRVVAVPLAKGQMLTETALAPIGTSGGLQAAVPAGKRAVTVEVNEVSGLSGLLKPGARVDIVATLTDDVTRETVTRAIVQNVPVSAVGRKMNVEGTGSDAKELANGVQVKTVTLIVTPHQASSLDLAYTRSKPRLVLRNAGEEDDTRFRPVTLTQLVHGTQPGAREEDRARFKGEAEAPSAIAQFLAAVAAQQAQRSATTAAASSAGSVGSAAATPPPTTMPIKRAIEMIRAGVPSMLYMEDVHPGVAAPPQPAAEASALPAKRTGLFESSDAAH